MDIEQDDTWNELLTQKGKRAKRRELDAKLDPGHLKAEFARTAWPEWDDIQTFGQFREYIQALRHSCHFYGCLERRRGHREFWRRERHIVRIELRKKLDDA